MCGAISVMLPTDNHNPIKKAFQLSIYHLGKLLAYGSIGLLFGYLGNGIYIAGYQQQLSIIIGLLMIVFILVPERVLAQYNFSKPIYRVISRIKSILGQQFKKKSYRSLFTIGLLNGYLPCGMVYVALFGATAMQTQWMGMLYMMLFGVGTIPLLVAVAYVNQILTPSTRMRFQKMIPYVAILIGMLFILRGLGLGIPYISPSNVNLLITDSPDCVTP
jgi:sulfite exporter TauE/SafE